CIGNSAAILTGAVPTGANGIYAYQWQLFNGTIWEDIPNATLKDYSPGVLIQTTKFRRNVSTNLCTGPQSNNSNEVTVTINPDAKAAFTAVKDSSCSPFLIDGNVIILQNDPSRNKDYQWYADGRFLGQGSNFPGYVINNAGDSVKIKLVAISNFGCLNDSIEKSFYTYITAKPSFTVTDTVGCGPLSVSFTNTTPNINSFQYLWDFGNGSTSSQSSPSAVTFLPNPKYGDTTYIVKLSVVTNCDTLIAFKSIRVKSKPKALFAPNSTVGCSPMRVIFSNTSLGIGNSYIWNFGDGSAPVSTNQIDTIGHTFYTGIRDTFYVKLFAGNECGIDSLTYAIVVSPNKIVLDFALNGNEQSGCTPHTVNFINNSKGASAFTWNFGDGSILNTTRNIDTVGHTYVSPGTYIITLNATNGCSDTSSTETIVVYPRPTAAFNVDLSTACIGETITFENNSDSATSYFWRFDDGSTSTLTSPSHAFSNAGTYSVVLKAYRFNAPGSVCEDSTVRNIEIVSNKPGAFIATDTIGYCAPFSVTFTNQNTPYISADWDFGDGTFGKGNTINHTFLTAGNYLVKLTVVVPGGCTYITTHTIRVLGPSGSLSYSKEYLCNNASITLQVQANNTDSLIFNFGDGTSLTTTTNMVSHVYQNAGIYLPSVTLKNKAGCSILLEGVDSVKVDKVKAGFSTVQQLNCGATLVNFTDTSIAFFGKTSVQWDLGDGTFSNGTTISHQYVTSGIYPVKMVVYGNSGCSDTIAQNLIIKVNNKPKAEIQGNTVSCVGYLNTYKANVSSIDSIRLIKWSLSNGVTESRNPVNFTFTQAGKYTLSLVIGTVNGCYDTASLEIQINPSPTVVSTTDMNICRGASVRLTATGTGNNGYSWSPVGDLSCTNCPDPIASPLQTTPFVVRGTNSFGCSASDTTVITVIQPLQLKVFPTDTICIGSSTNLLASGASSYSWSPSSGLSNTSIPNPIASPDVTTSYRVVGYDGYNCFTDTAFVLVAVGQYPIVNLGPDLILSTGTMQTLKSVVQNGPIVNWLWTPGKDLSCNTCALPIAEVKKDITYTVEVTNNYGCSATDTIMVKAFCQSAQVFIPNAFTPDGDGINDVLMVRGQGIVMVKTFRIFNRWGEVVFERSDFPPNNPGYGWNGKINGIAGGPDVFVYTADVVCENGSTYTYKGNVSIIK
ncbi:MAG: PKD domain-containing protein, partial [Flavisolibacter sp.]